MSVPNSHAGSADPKRAQISCGFLCRKFLKLIFVLLAFLLYCAVVPLFALFMVPVYVYRVFVIVLQKLLYPAWIGIMNSRDALVALDDTTKRCDCMIIASICFQGAPDVAKILDYFQRNVIDAQNSKGEKLYKKFGYYYENWMGFPFWKKEKDFKLGEHLRLFEYPINKSPVVLPSGKVEQVVTEDELMRVLGQIEKLPFGKEKSPWEILVLPNFVPRKSENAYLTPELTKLGDNEDKVYFTLVFRLHHAIGDGFSFLKMLMCHICDDKLENVHGPKEPRKVGLLIKILHMIAILVYSPYFHVRQFVIDIDRSLWHLPSYKLSKDNHFVGTTLHNMKMLRRAGKAHNVPLTGVFLAALGGGIHNFLKITGKAKRFPDCMRALSPLPWKNHPALNESDGLANHWTLGVFTIPVKESTPEKRLKVAKQSVYHLVNSPILISNFYTVPILLSAPNFLTDFWGTNWMASQILSNFPGPKEVITFGGQHPVDSCITFVPHMRGSAGLGVMFPTYRGNVRCTISVDKAIIEDYGDAQLLAGLIDEEFRILATLPGPSAEYQV